MKRAALFVLTGFLIVFALNVHAQGTSTVDSFVDEKVDDIADIVKERVGEEAQELQEEATSRVRGFFGRIADFINEKVGVNIVEGIKLLGAFFIWMFEALATFVRWILGFFA